MGKILYVVFFLTSSIAFAESTLICKSKERVEGWKGTRTFDFVHFTAYVSGDVRGESKLSQARVGGAYGSDQADLFLDSKYRPRSQAYKDFDRYSPLEDAWFTFFPLMPKNLIGQRSFFEGYLHILDEEGFRETVSLRCFLRGN